MHIHTGKGQLPFNVAHLDHLCKICKLINWLQVVFSSSPKAINVVLNGASCPDDAQEMVAVPASVPHHPSPPVPLMVVQAKDQNFKLLVALTAATSRVVLCHASGGKLARDFQGALEGKEDFLHLQYRLWYSMML